MRAFIMYFLSYLRKFYLFGLFTYSHPLFELVWENNPTFTHHIYTKSSSYIPNYRYIKTNRQPQTNTKNKGCKPPIPPIPRSSMLWYTQSNRNEESLFNHQPRLFGIPFILLHSYHMMRIPHRKCRHIFCFFF